MPNPVSRRIAAVGALLSALLLAAPASPQDGRRMLQRLRSTAPARCGAAARHGAVLKATPDGLSYYVYWSPELERGAGRREGGRPASRPRRVLVTLHGEDGSAIDEFLSWRLQAAERGVAIVAPQWRLGPGHDAPDSYSPYELNACLQDILGSLGIRAGQAMLHGYHGASSRLYGLMALDRSQGRRFFALAVADSGGADPGFPVNALIERGGLGIAPLAGTRWILYCGGAERRPKRDGCPAMRRTRGWLEGLGGVVSLDIRDPKAGDGGLCAAPDRMGAALDSFLALSGAPRPHKTLTSRPSPARRPRVFNRRPRA